MVKHFCLLLVLLLGMASSLRTCAAVQLTRDPEVSASTHEATVRWTTDVECGTRVQFGTSPGRLDRRESGPVGTNHVVILKGLRPGTTYHFTAGTARTALTTNSFVTLRIPDAVGAGASTGRVPTETGKPPTSDPNPQPRPPPSKVTWGSPRSLPDHFERHGGDFQARSSDDYAAQAWLFLVRAKADGLPAKRDSEGTLRVFDPRSGAFAAYNPDGTTKTYFKPGRRGYFDDQPGTPVDLRKLDDFQPPR